MGFLNSLLGKNETGSIIDITGISSVNVHLTLRYLSEIYQNNTIVCISNSDEYLDHFNKNIFWGARCVGFTNRSFCYESPQKEFNSPVKGVNLIDKEYFDQFISRGIFSWIQKPVIFTDDVNMVKSSLQWSVIEKPDSKQASDYWRLIMNVYNDIKKGKTTSTNDLTNSFTNFYVKVEKAVSITREDLGAPSEDIGQCVHYLMKYNNCK